MPAFRRFPGDSWVLLSGLLIPLAIGLVAWWVPDDADQGYSQRIFYFHVPIALTTYAAFAFGAVCAAMYLKTRDPKWDLRSYVGVHVGSIFGTLVLVTGGIWAKVSWGVWWNWSDRQLNVFLVLFLYYCAYFMLRFSVDEGEQRRSYSAVYTLLGVGLIPLSILAVRIGQTLIHPTVFTTQGAAMTHGMFLTFLVALAGMLCLGSGMIQLELRGKRVALRARELRRRLEGTDL
jgi:heme exporter protein C